MTIPFYEKCGFVRSHSIKPCAITDDDGEVVADDFPPDYNYLQDYVYKIVSSFDFIESPEECTIKIADAFKCYTEKYYTGEEIIYFEDYSVEKVIELSEISKKWNDKFKRADKCKEEFLNLPICKKVKNIIDELSINEYVKNKGIVTLRMPTLKNGTYKFALKPNKNFTINTAKLQQTYGNTARNVNIKNAKKVKITKDAYFMFMMKYKNMDIVNVCFQG